MNSKNANMNAIPPEELRMITRAAWLYYMQGLTQSEIADELKLSRVKVTRLVSRAKALGMVEIRVIQPPGFFVGLEQELIKRYQLKDAVITLDVSSASALRRVLARAAAEWLTPRLDNDTVVGFSMGRTLALLPEVTQPMEPTGATFIEVMGASDSLNSGFSSYTVIGRMAEICGGQARLLDVPTFVSSPPIRDLILEEELIAKRFEMARNCQILVTSVGTVDKDALMHKIGYLTDDVLDQLKREGAVGDLLGQFFDAKGQHISTPLDGRVMALQLDDLKNIPFSVLVSGGKEKEAAIRAALEGEYVNVLITDVKTANNLLQ
ncbi:MAG: sugar-binding transcriptional regulator [Anaerolineaceae bacterium]|jgi:DNA-binding transcriptional regulator LsrR (DeoR family)|nr:sugar-binding transcriptional regulator [Anaerolineaceae bacterium]